MMRWHDGDVVQTQVPYDDFPITVVRENGTWRGVLPPHLANNYVHTDENVTEWVTGEAGIAVVKIKQEHSWLWDKRGEAPNHEYIPTKCDLCGVQYTDLPEAEREEG